MSDPAGFDRWPGMCRKAAYGPSGFGSAYSPVEHDWRLLSRVRTFGEVEHEVVRQNGWLETWYCTRCRTVDEREVKT